MVWLILSYLTHVLVIFPVSNYEPCMHASKCCLNVNYIIVLAQCHTFIFSINASIKVMIDIFPVHHLSVVNPSRQFRTNFVKFSPTVWFPKVTEMDWVLVVDNDNIFDPFGRNQFPAILNSSVQQSSLSVEQDSTTPLLSTVNRVLLLVSLVPCSTLTPAHAIWSKWLCWLWRWYKILHDYTFA